LPAKAKNELGIDTLEVCHFHLVQDPHELERFHGACVRSQTRLFQLLIDAGDITHPTDTIAHLEWIGGWIGAAAHAGFERVRIIGGMQPPTLETMRRAAEGFRMLQAVAQSQKVEISTENWHELLATADAVTELLDCLSGEIGLVADFGNFSGPSKYEELAAIAPLATSLHAKCNFNGGEPDAEDFDKCLEIVARTGFKGVATLVHPEPSDNWAALAKQKALFLA
jgi:sugar phosphate isomerase/epimerase